jgi:hypothetical protein
MNCGCTTWRPTEANPQEIQHLIESEGLLAPGDRVKLVTADNAVHVHEFRVDKLDLEEGLVIGSSDVVRISDIVSVEKRKTSWLKTGLLIGGLALATMGTECSDDCGEIGGFYCC